MLAGWICRRIAWKVIPGFLADDHARAFNSLLASFRSRGRSAESRVRLRRRRVSAAGDDRIGAHDFRAAIVSRERRERSIVGRHKLLMRLFAAIVNHQPGIRPGMLRIHRERWSLKSYRTGRERSRIPYAWDISFQPWLAREAQTQANLKSAARPWIANSWLRGRDKNVRNCLRLRSQGRFKATTIAGWECPEGSSLSEDLKW